MKKTITVTKFWAPWCQPCLLMGPAWRKIEGEYEDRVIFREVNTETDEGRARAVARDVLGLPTIIFQVNGKDVARVDGAMRYPQMKTQLDSLLT